MTNWFYTLYAREPVKFTIASVPLDAPKARVGNFPFFKQFKVNCNLIRSH